MSYLTFLTKIVNTTLSKILPIHNSPKCFQHFVKVLYTLSLTGDLIKTNIMLGLALPDSILLPLL